jgi:hypothetical protein
LGIKGLVVVVVVDPAYCWNLIKGPIAPSISPGFYSMTGRGGPSIMV